MHSIVLTPKTLVSGHTNRKFISLLRLPKNEYQVIRVKNSFPLLNKNEYQVREVEKSFPLLNCRNEFLHFCISAFLNFGEMRGNGTNLTKKPIGQKRGPNLHLYPSEKHKCSFVIFWSSKEIWSKTLRFGRKRVPNDESAQKMAQNGPPKVFKLL